MDKTLIEVISLDDSKERRDSFERMAVDTELQWNFFSAHRQLLPPLEYNELLAIRRFGRPLTKGERGVYASHFAVWRYFLETNYSQILILEDDVIVDWNCVRFLCSVDLAQYDINILRMFATHKFKNELVINRFISAHHHLLRSGGLAVGIQGYMLTRKGAEALISLGNTVFEPADWAICRFEDYLLPNYFLFPFPILERMSESVIGSKGREEEYNSRLIDWVRRFFWRLRKKIKREFVMRFLFKRRPFGMVSDIGQNFIDKYR